MLYKLLTFTILCVTYLNLKAQEQQIKVYNQTTGAPVENVAIYNIERNIATLTDKQGIANLTKFSTSDSIFFQHPSYTPLASTKNELLELEYIFLSRKNIIMDEFVISATKIKDNKKDIPYKVDVIEADKVHHTGVQTSAELLTSTGNVVIQKSQGGGGSPILRGFEANKVLLVLDGVRMNNAIYRSGHLQNSITIDNNALDRVEIIYGPTSVIYGSDALGGVIHYFTKDPELSDDGSPRINASLHSEYSSANDGKIGSFSYNHGLNKFGSFTNLSISDFGDIKMGKNREPFLKDFGKACHYATRINGEDSTLRNPNPNVQIGTGYKQYDLLQKFKYKFSNRLSLILNLQYSTSSNIDRYDKLNDYSGNNLKYAEWYYGPQKRLFGSLNTTLKHDNPFFSSFSNIIAFQKIDEDRISRNFGDNEKLYHLEDVYVYSINHDFIKSTGADSRMNYGYEATYNTVNSDAYYRNIVNGEKSKAETTRYPDEGSQTFSLSAYGSYRWYVNEKVILSTGLRYNYSNLFSSFSDKYMQLPFSEVNINNGAVTGSLSGVFHPSESWQVNVIAATGYRNPNVDDYGKIRAKGNEITIPNNDLGPEYTYNLELGLSKTIDRFLRIEGNAFVTYITDAIVRKEATYNGSDTMLYNDHYYNIITNTNANEAVIRGVSVNIQADFTSNISFTNAVNYLQGDVLSKDEPLAHIPPLFGRSAFVYKTNRFKGEIYAYYNGWKTTDDMSPHGEDNEDEASDNGFPSWITFNTRVSYLLADNLNVAVGVENIFDKFYKPFASGVAAAGRNFIVSMKLSI